MIVMEMSLRVRQVGAPVLPFVHLTLGNPTSTVVSVLPCVKRDNDGAFLTRFL